ncbi:MAG: CDP-glycerol glycerophosphotransferase family protein [Alteromonadaceae bacterium]|nr:CDP-glycerol glycerophosphotransferase family protein [Alteromonadaceae bacterium]
MKNYLFYISENYSFKILRPLQDEINKRGDQVKWFVEGDNVNQSYFKNNEEQIATVEEIKYYDPCAVFAPGNFVPSFIPGIKVHVFHGFVGGKRRKKDNTIYHFIMRGCFDLYCTHGLSSTKKFQELAEKHQYFDVVETGFCQMDPYFNSQNKSIIKKKEKPTILFSSTFSPRMTQAPALLKTIEYLSKNTPWHWQVTFHPKMASNIVNSYKAIQHKNLTLIETDNLIPYMKNADLMLADYSSMITDFILLNKPVVTFKNPDNLSHLININNTDEIEKSITLGLTKPETLMIKIKTFNQLTHPYRDGKSSFRVLNAVEKKLESSRQLKKKPLNLLRNLKLRTKLSYWSI